MAWITPKTDWEVKPYVNGQYAGDWFNWTDYERIRGNLKILRDFASSLFGAFPYIFMTTIDEMVAKWPNLNGYTDGATITDDMRYASLYAENPNIINVFERNIDIIVGGVGNTIEVDPTKTWTNNSYVPTYEDWNRIESTTLKLLDYLIYIDSTRPIGIEFEIEASIAGEFDL